jgi:transporter family-2 protein
MTIDARPKPTLSRTAIVASMVLAFLCGAGIATQSRINGELGRQLNDGFAAAAISFGSGLVIVLIALAFSRSGRRGARQVAFAVRTRRIPFWYVLGGGAGAFLVLTQGLVAGILGVALFTIGIVAGQTISGLFIDRRGLGTMQPKPLTVQRLVGSVLALIAVGIAVSAQLSTAVPLWMLVLPFLAGTGTGWQQAVNGQVREIAESALTATLINFTVGTLVLVIALLIDSTVQGWPAHLPTAPWLYLGGAIGVFFIAAAAVLVPVIGVLLLGLGTIAGQLVTSLVIDQIAPAAGQTTAVTTVVGTGLTLVAVGIAAVPARKRRVRGKA